MAVFSLTSDEAGGAGYHTTVEVLQAAVGTAGANTDVAFHPQFCPWPCHAK